jgi:hypothetical protein
LEYSTCYADLRGGDVINLGYYNNQLDTDMIWSWESTEVIADLEQILSRLLKLSCISNTYDPTFLASSTLATENIPVGENCAKILAGLRASR